MKSLTLQDSRRLTGPNIVTAVPGAIIDVTADGQDITAAVELWREQARRMLDAVGWWDETPHVRPFPGGASLVITAPIDALYAATEVNEWAWSAAGAVLAGSAEPQVDDNAERLRAEIAKERNPRLIEMQRAAQSHDVNFMSDDEHVSIGMGFGSRTWPVDRIVEPEHVPWDAVCDIPVALVTGSNGKTTTVRLLAAMARAWGKTAGCTTTDGIYLGDEVVDQGDWSGPGGARYVLRDRKVDLAILETARGGMLRRGLAVRRADVAIVTNVAADHLGEFGISDVDDIAEAKLVVRRAVEPSGTLVANADDRVLAPWAEQFDVNLAWISLDAENDYVQASLDRRELVCVLEGQWLILVRGGTRTRVAEVDQVPIAFGGAARHNIYNALGSIVVASKLGVPLEAIRHGLMTFGEDADENPGRGNHFVLGGVDVLVDFAHNPHGMQAMVEMAAAMRATRRLIVLGQAGDRDDQSIRELARVARGLCPELVIVKEMATYLRGRSAGEIPTMIAEELQAGGVPPTAIQRAPSELDAVRQALEWARPGDLLILPTHESRESVLALMHELKRTEWSPGQALPGIAAR